jgi:hypothetical protein
MVRAVFCFALPASPATIRPLTTATRTAEALQLSPYERAQILRCLSYKASWARRRPSAMMGGFKLQVERATR